VRRITAPCASIAVTTVRAESRIDTDGVLHKPPKQSSSMSASVLKVRSVLFFEPDPFKGILGPALTNNRPKTAKSETFSHASVFHHVFRHAHAVVTPSLTPAPTTRDHFAM
jgi:hypothetical protein